MVRKILIVVFALVIGGLSYFLYQSVAKPVTWRAEKEKRYTAIKKRLDDIRKAQISHKAIKGKYAPNFAQLIFFLKNDKLKRSKKVKLGTSFVDVGEFIKPADSLFNVGYNVSLMRYVPYVDTIEFKITIRDADGTEFLEVADPVPFDPEEPLSIGSLIEPTLKGSWEKDN